MKQASRWVYPTPYNYRRYFVFTKYNRQYGPICKTRTPHPAETTAGPRERPRAWLTWIYIVQEAPLKVGRKSHQDAFAATHRPPAEKIYTRTYFNTPTNNSEYKTLFCTFIGELLSSHECATRATCATASPLPFIPIVRATCLPMVLLPSNTAADLNSYDREYIFVRNTFPAPRLRPLAGCECCLCSFETQLRVFAFLSTCFRGVNMNAVFVWTMQR